MPRVREGRAEAGAVSFQLDVLWYKLRAERLYLKPEPMRQLASPE
jgi:hypothetical protein